MHSLIYSGAIAAMQFTQTVGYSGLQIVRVERSTRTSVQTFPEYTVSWESVRIQDVSAFNASVDATKLVVPAGYSRARATTHVVFPGNMYRSINIYANAGELVARNTYTDMVYDTPGGMECDTGWVSVSEGSSFYCAVSVTTSSEISVGVGPSFFQLELLA